MLPDVSNHCCDGNFGPFLLMIDIRTCSYGEDKSWEVVAGAKREARSYEEGHGKPQDIFE